MLEQIDYERVNEAKLKYLYEVYLQEGEKKDDARQSLLSSSLPIASNCPMRVICVSQYGQPTFL